MEAYLESLGIIAPGRVHRNMSVPGLVQRALERNEGTLSDAGALVVTTGKYTGRSPYDRFVVDEPSCHDDIDWGNVNVPISSEKFDGIYNRITAYLQGREIFIFDGFAGADTDYRLPVRVINELASENLFVHQLLLRPTQQELDTFEPNFTILCAPGFKCIPEVDGTNSQATIILNFAKKMIIIAGSRYAGEIKKSIFSVMNYLLPKKNVLTMHCSANIGKKGDTALFFGLSGTGKTTLSADPERKLIGDDEHGWSDHGVFNFEGGCYAKCINLSRENEPQIWNAIKFGTLVENVIMDVKTCELNYNDGSLTENIPNCELSGMGGHPSTLIFLTADAFGVLPPISRLSREQAMYHFVSGYTSKLAGTERGIVEPQTTFSTCFGAPFMPLLPSVYATMLGKKIDEHGSNVYLINTGWSGGKYGVGKRISIKYTRAMVAAALNGELDQVKFELDPIFNVFVPTECPNVPSELLNPRNTWTNKLEYDKAAKDLATRFVKNFNKYQNMPRNIIDAGPRG